MVESGNNETGARVLVVDDDATNRFIAMTVLSQAGYETVEAQNGVEAVEAALAAPPAVILMDLSMPILNGLDAARELRKRAADSPLPPIVALTGNVTPEHRAACEAAGFSGFISKPIDIDELLEVVASLLP